MSEEHPGARLAQVFHLEAIDRDTFLAVNPTSDQPQRWIFGGQLVAQSARAAGMTVRPDRTMHSLHGYYLKAGRAEEVTTLHVDRDRDGRSFSSRLVTARQDDEVIMRLLASFHVVEDSREFQVPTVLDVTPPEEVPEHAHSVHRETFEVRALGLGPPSGAYWRTPYRFWARARTALPPDQVVHACVLTYLSDVGTGLAQLRDARTGSGPSLDHAVWFHRPARMDDWVFVDLQPATSAGGRGYYTGNVYDRRGTLLATIAQEHVARDFTPM